MKLILTTKNIKDQVNILLFRGVITGDIYDEDKKNEKFFFQSNFP